QLRGHKPRIASGSAADLQYAAFRGQPLPQQGMKKGHIGGFVVGEEMGGRIAVMLNRLNWHSNIFI
ncbi:MAG TPA: hypothetical protein PKN04_16885, partial [bacterium]|nr:hypothetical protein [bacterium]